MATNISQFSSGGAPADFPLSSSYEHENNTRSSTHLEKCPLCYNARKIFYCQQCIHDGNFYHSNAITERYAEKRLDLILAKKRLNFVVELCEQILGKQIKVYNLKNEIDSCQERIRILKCLINEKKEKISSDERRRDDLKKENQRKSIFKVYTSGRNRFKDMMKHRNQQQEKTEEGADTEDNQKKMSNFEKLIETQKNIQEMIKKDIQHLTEYIFPIELVQPTQSSEASKSGTDPEIQDTVTALADASRTTYIRGRWIFNDTSGELHHCIVAPTLPGSGDYSAYNTWVTTNKDSVPTGPSEGCERNVAYSISAALTYTTQLLNVLAYYLDVRLPYRLNYSEFCGNELTDRQFARKVAKLNCNILHLCFSQNINPELLQSTHTLQNLLTLLNSENIVEDFGRRGRPIELDPVLTMNLEEPLLRDLENNRDSSSDEESDHLPFEWEAVAHSSCPESCVSSMTPNQTMMTTQQAATSIAGGLVTSAAASIASIFRGWAGNK